MSWCSGSVATRPSTRDGHAQKQEAKDSSWYSKCFNTAWIVGGDGANRPCAHDCPEPGRVVEGASGQFWLRVGAVGPCRPASGSQEASGCDVWPENAAVLVRVHVLPLRCVCPRKVGWMKRAAMFPGYLAAGPRRVHRVQVRRAVGSVCPVTESIAGPDLACVR